MRTIAILQTTIITLVLGAVLAPYANGAEEPDPINIVAANLKRGLTANDTRQIDEHVQYWITTLVDAKKSATVYKAREGILADYGKYGSGEKSMSYQVGFARSTAKAVPAGIAKLSKADPLKSLKDINLGIVVSEMKQATIAPALDALVKHEAPAVRLLAWRGYLAIRDNLIRAGGDVATTMQSNLANLAGSESNPLVAEVIVEILNIKKADLATKAFRDAFDQNFKTLAVLLKTSCNHLATGQAGWARPCLRALPILKAAADYYKPDAKSATAILQQLLNIAHAGAKAYASSDGLGAVAFQCTPLLLQAEPILATLSNNTDVRDIRDPLLDRKKSALEKSKAVRRGVLEWLDHLEDAGVKKPVFTPIKPAATTQPVKPAV
ncbi:MAG: hypothetical protein HN350_15330 [Phycisphaerales bacterium]|jgi:hypothetical protein|nr:hypothetical protein [Phycisphaerales bacterium]